MHENEHEGSLREYVRLLRRHSLLILAVAGAAVFASLAYSKSQDPTYEAQASLSFKDVAQDVDVLGTPAAPVQQPDELAAARRRTITEPTVVTAVKQALHTNKSPAELRDAVSVRVEPQSNLVTIQARAGTARGAQRLASAFAAETERTLIASTRQRYTAAARRLRSKLNTRRNGGDPSIRAVYADRISRLAALGTFARPVEIYRSAQLPDSPASPKPVRNATVAGILGLLLGGIAAFGRSALDRRLHTSGEIEGELELPVLGYVREAALGRVPAETNGRGRLEDADLEAFRVLRANVEFLDLDKPPRSVIVTSALPQEGKSTVAASLAFASAAVGKRTLLLESDLRRPVMAKRFGVPPEPGLSDYLAGNASSGDVLLQLALPPQAENGKPVDSESFGGKPSIDCIPAGSSSSQPAEMLGSERFKHLMNTVTESYDVVVLDTSPLLPVVDSLELVPLVDAILMCVRVSQTTRDEMSAARSALGHFPDRPMGLVITGVRPRDERDYGYYSSPYV